MQKNSSLPSVVRNFTVVLQKISVASSTLGKAKDHLFNDLTLNYLIFAVNSL